MVSVMPKLTSMAIFYHDTEANDKRFLLRNAYFYRGQGNSFFYVIYQ
jgi:hypothetical protein